MAIAFIAATEGSGNTTSATTAAMNTTGASLIVIGVSLSAIASGYTVSDSAGNTWTALTPATIPTSFSTVLLYCATPVTSTTHTFTISNGTAIFPAITAIAFSGTSKTPFDVQNGAETASLVTTLQPGSVTPSLNAEVVVTVACNVSGNSTWSIDSGFTIPTFVTFVGGTAESTALAYLIQGTAATVNPTWTQGAGGGMAASIATFELGVATGTAIYEVQQSLSILAGQSTRPYLDAQKAANVYAGTTGLELLYALNKKAGTSGLDLNKVCNVLAGTTGKEAQDALSNLAGGGHT